MQLSIFSTLWHILYEKFNGGNSMEKKLNHLLADLVVEYHKLQNFHWYVKGKDFFTVHAKLEEYYNAINKSIDEVAENILMINGKPLAMLKEFLEETSFTEVPGEFITSQEIFAEVLKDFKHMLGHAENIKKSADEENQFAISALMDEEIEFFKKAIWMIGQQSE